jgi:hypothetical protein
MYPNEELVYEHLAHEGLTLSILIALIFLFTSSILAFFNCIVRRWRNIITKQAGRTTAIVANLLLEGLRNRMVGPEVKQCPASSKPTADTDLIADLFQE